MARVRVIADTGGFDGIQKREMGEEFDFGGAPGDWFEYLDPKEGEAAAAKHREEVVKSMRDRIEAEVRSQVEVKIRAEIEAKLRAQVETEVRAKLVGAGQDAAAELV
jgi:hypothetical protein